MEQHASHGVRRLAALESAAGSFGHATGQVRERTGVALGKRQVEELAVRAAVDFDSFYAERMTAAQEQEQDEHDVLVLSADGSAVPPATRFALYDLPGATSATRPASAAVSPAAPVIAPCRACNTPEGGITPQLGAMTLVRIVGPKSALTQPRLSRIAIDHGPTVGVNPQKTLTDRYRESV
ncbi:MAG: hypothetical protein ACLP22_13800 [Solirubrobacteraceae bacterium]